MARSRWARQFWRRRLLEFWPRLSANCSPFSGSQSRSGHVHVLVPKRRHSAWPTDAPLHGGESPNCLCLWLAHVLLLPSGQLPVFPWQEASCCFTASCSVWCSACRGFSGLLGAAKESSRGARAQRTSVTSSRSHLLPCCTALVSAEPWPLGHSEHQPLLPCEPPGWIRLHRGWLPHLLLEPWAWGRRGPPNELREVPRRNLTPNQPF